MRRTWTWIVWVPLFAAIVGCGGAEVPSTQGEQTYVVRGLYLGPAPDGAAMRVSHEEIPGFMAAMTMDFPVRDSAEIANLAPGDKIEFVLVAAGYDSYAREIRRLPSETELEIPE